MRNRVQFKCRGFMKRSRWRRNGMDIKSTDRHLTWILLVFNKSIVLEKNLKQNKRLCNCITCLKEYILWKGFMKKLNQILHFEIRTFYRFIDLYRTYLNFSRLLLYNLIENFSIMRKRLYLWNNTKFRGLLMNITEAILPDTKSPVVNYSRAFKNSLTTER